MIHRFGDFELDLGAAELRRDGARVPVEPQVFSLLAVLAGARGRLVPREELIQRVWQGRPVADATLASRIKSARQAVGDDGGAQRIIRTVHGLGYRFVADLDATPATAVDAAASPPQGIVVLPMRVTGDPGGYGFLATALPHELISAMARLRWLYVTARGSAFRIDPVSPDFGAIRQLLQVRYALAGELAIHGRRLAVMVQVIDTGDGHVVWAEHFEGALEDIDELRRSILARTLAAIEVSVPQEEAARARRRGIENLDAWAAFHLGLQEAYRFRRETRAAAAALFERAIALDPGFARAHSGLSFVHFQSAFLRDAGDSSAAMAAARRHAEQGVQLDPIDPFVNFTMGRCHWLEGDLEGSLGWLERATAISPHYAQGMYARAWSEVLLGDAVSGRRHVDLAMRLSPLDPLYYAMLGTRAFTHLHAGERAEAAEWAERAARAPDAHVLIEVMAAAMQRLAGNAARARDWADRVRSHQPALTAGDFFRSFPMRAPALREPMRRALDELGF